MWCCFVVNEMEDLGLIYGVRDDGAVWVDCCKISNSNPECVLQLERICKLEMVKRVKQRHCPEIQRKLQ